MIQIIAKLFATAPRSRMEAVSRQVADLSVESVCQLVSDRVQNMTFSEARGYVRARAIRVVRKQARLALSGHPRADVAWLEEVTRAATEQIVPIVLRQTGVGVLKPSQLRMAA